MPCESHVAGDAGHDLKKDAQIASMQGNSERTIAQACVAGRMQISTLCQARCRDENDQ
jgi:hypothetical protein